MDSSVSDWIITNLFSQLANHGVIPPTTSVHVAVCAKMRGKLVSEVRANIDKLRGTLAECVEVLASGCRTHCLAHLHMSCPPPVYWRQSGPLPDCASDYVENYLGDSKWDENKNISLENVGTRIPMPVWHVVSHLDENWQVCLAMLWIISSEKYDIINFQPSFDGLNFFFRQSNTPIVGIWQLVFPSFSDCILKPVLLATDSLPPAVQVSSAAMVLRIVCESWLEYIYLHRYKFSEWGAVQLLTDFGAVPTWLMERVKLPKHLLNPLLTHEVSDFIRR